MGAGEVERTGNEEENKKIYMFNVLHYETINAKERTSTAVGLT